MVLTKPIRGLIFQPTLPTQQKHAAGIPCVVELTEALRELTFLCPWRSRQGPPTGRCWKPSKQLLCPSPLQKSKRLSNIKVDVVLMGKSKELIFHPLLHGRR